MQTASPFAGQEFITRPWIQQLLARGVGWWDYLKSYFDQGTLAAAGVKDLESFVKWYPTVRDYLSPNAEGLLKRLKEPCLTVYSKLDHTVPGTGK